MVFFVFWSRAMWVIKLVGGRRRSPENSSCEGDADGALSTGQGPFSCRLVRVRCPRRFKRVRALSFVFSHASSPEGPGCLARLT